MGPWTLLEISKFSRSFSHFCLTLVGMSDRVMDVAIRSERSLKAARKVMNVWDSKALLSPSAVQPITERVTAEQPFERPFAVRTRPRAP